MIHPCDICGASKALSVSAFESKVQAKNIFVCGNCGFVYVPERRTEQEIADSWTHEIFGDGYTSNWPLVRARLFYVAQILHDFLLGVFPRGGGDTEATTPGLRIADVGAGEGLLLKYLRETLGAECDLWGIEPSEQNCASLNKSGFMDINGTLQSAINREPALKSSLDLVTLTWTLENTNDPNEVVAGARELLTNGGYLLVATGSRILVPFKKLLDEYLGTNTADTHAFRWSRKSLGNLLAKHGFTIAFENRWQDSDWMVLIAKKGDKPTGDSWLEPDDPRAVIDFFSRWAETSDWLTKQVELESHRGN